MIEAPQQQKFYKVAKTANGNIIYGIICEKIDSMEAWKFRHKADKMDSIKITETTIQKSAFKYLHDSCQKAKQKSRPIYAIDSEESLFEKGSPWNMNEFNTNHSIIHQGMEKMAGINTSYVNIGMRFTWFPAHTEDSALASLNFLHSGAPKYWYCVSSKNARLFEDKLMQHIGELFECNTVYRHKFLIVTPEFLDEFNIPYTTMTQYPGEIVATMYDAYHWGFNSGFNICESVNVASPIYRTFHDDSKICSTECL